MAELTRKENMITQDGLFSPMRVQYKDTDRSRIRPAGAVTGKAKINDKPEKVMIR